MGNVVYLDILIVLNIFVTFFLILGTRKLLHCRLKRWRMLVGSALGGFFSLSILLELSPPLQILMKLTMGIILVFVTFFVPKGGRVSFLKSLLVFIGVNFLYGGLMFALWFFVAPSGMAYKNGVAYFQITALQLTIATIIAYGCVVLFCRWLDRRGCSKNYIDVQIGLDGKEILVRGLVDTGNKLLDVFTGLPVIVCRLDAVSGVLPIALREYIENPLTSGLGRQKQGAVIPTVKAGFRLLPVTVVGAELLLPAFKPEFVRIGKWEGSAVVAVTVKSFGSNEFDAIVPSALGL